MKEFEKWFKKAEQDLFTIQALLKLEDCPPEICCFLAHQAAEKYLKAYLISKKIGFPKIHDIIKLVLLCANINPVFITLKDFALGLIDYAVTPRYPDDTRPNFRRC